MEAKLFEWILFRSVRNAIEPDSQSRKSWAILYE